MKALHKPKIYELLSEWLAYIHHRHSRHTYIGYERTLRQLRKAGPARYEDLTPQRIEQFLQSLPLATNSINTALTVIKSFCRWCEEFHDLPNPAHKVKYLKPAPVKQRVLSPEELQKVLAVCNNGRASMLLFLANTGLRVSELQSLTEQNLSPDGRLLYIVGKGGKSRAVPLNQTAKANLPKTINFLKSHQGPKTIYNVCARLAKKAGIPKFGPHALRHSLATQLAKNVPLCTLSKLLGHANTLITSKVYVHLQDNDLIGVTDILDN